MIYLLMMKMIISIKKYKWRIKKMSKKINKIKIIIKILMIKKIIIIKLKMENNKLSMTNKNNQGRLLLMIIKVYLVKKINKNWKIILNKQQKIEI